MNTVDTIGNNTAIQQVITQPKVNFRAVNSYYIDNDVDTFVKQKQKEQKRAKTKQNIMYGLQAGAMAAIIASIFFMAKQSSGMGKKTSELKEIWHDLTNAPKIEDLALPESLNKFINNFENAIANPEILKNRGGKATRSLLLYGPPGTGKTTFAKALAKKFPDAKFASLDVTSLGSEYQSVSERNLNKAVDMICKDAEKNPNKKYFVFIDEIDSVMMEDNSLGAKHSNDMLNEFKKCFTEKLGKRDNIITIGATNLPINVEKGITLGGKKLDKPMLDRFGEKVLVDLPTKEQIANAVKHHYKDCSLVENSLKENTKALESVSEFLAEKCNNVSFRTLDAIYDATASSIKNKEAKISINDILNTIQSKKAELNYKESDYSNLLSTLNA